uniref:ankyrin repeat-containing protein BDA1-like n=1 Tax=Erigeron canadensis TaxID=72917 RepID=UPI001CB96232|nr:ankyrin repeat-containing protein BDA1-like [Erigeron canadensis]
MDERLFQAAWNGDVDHLLKEIKSNPSILHAAALEGGENPLHIACLAGHLNFAAKVIELKQNFTSELNQDGFSPLHIAAACGHVNIVKELLKVDLDLCLIEGKDRKIPLHLAVVKGKVEVIRELILSSLDSIECTTAQGETSSHLAVKNHQFKALQLLVHHLKQENKEYLLNSKDIHGNTVLHLAVSRKQYEVVDFLLNGQAISKENLELNSLNNSGLAPLDMLPTFRSEAGDLEIEELLIQAGALRTENLPNPEYTQQTPHQADRRQENGSLPPAKKLLQYFKYNNIKDSPSKVRDTLLVIVILITSATYQPALSPPGGTWQDDSAPSSSGNSTLSSATNNTSATEPHTAGQAIMGTHNPISYSIFQFSNSLGFYTSLHMLCILTKSFPLRMEFYLIVGALASTYGTCMGAIAPYSYISWSFTGISIALPFMIPVTTRLLRNYWQRPKPWNGDVDYLLKELDTNPSMLHAVGLEDVENPSFFLNN